MKKVVCIFVTFIMIIALTGCSGGSNTHEGEAKTPSGSNVQKGRNYQSVADDFEKKGFINIKTKALDDLVTGWLTKDGEVESVSVDGDEKYSADKWYSNDVEVIITYHTFPKDKEKTESTSPDLSEANDSQQDTNNEAAITALEAVLPVENAKRAAVVAITNYYAIDVFAADGNTYDVSKFHSYKDTAGNFFDYLMHVNSWGTWTAKNKLWHVDSLVLENSFGTIANVSMDISHDGSNYVISNLAGKFGDNEMDVMNEDPLFLAIPPKLISEDRTQTKTESHHKWVINQFSSWDGSHKALKELIQKSLNDEKSFKHIETSYRVVFAEDIKDDINKVLKSSNKTAKIEIGDLWISTEFSAKNAFNATVKNTAYGIVSYSNNTVTLVAVE